MEGILCKISPTNNKILEEVYDNLDNTYICLLQLLKMYFLEPLCKWT